MANRGSLDKQSAKAFLKAYHTQDIRTLEDNYPDQMDIVIKGSDLNSYDEELFQSLLQFPKESIQSLNEGLRYSDVHDAAMLPFVRVYPSLSHHHRFLGEYSGREIGNLVQTSIRIDSFEEDQHRAIIGGYRCKACNHLTVIEDVCAETSEPYQCDGCERSSTEIILDEEASSFVDYKTGIATDCMDLLSGINVPETFKVSLVGSNSKDIESSDWIEVTGILSADVNPKDGSVDKRLIVLFASETSPETVEKYAERSPSEFPSNPGSISTVFGSGQGELSQMSLIGYRELIEEVFSNHSPDDMKEEDLKVKILLPLVEILGWDIFCEEVRMEYGGEGLELWEDKGAVDFGLLLDGVPKVGIEAKQPTSAISWNAQEQLQHYLTHFGFEWGLLTNGKRFKLFRGADKSHQIANIGYELLPAYRSEIENLHRSNFQ